MNDVAVIDQPDENSERDRDKRAREWYVKVAQQALDAIHPDTVSLAYRAYMYEGKTLDEVAIEFKIPISDVLAMAQSLGWVEKRTAMLQVMLRDADARQLTLMAEHVNPERTRQLNMGRAMADAIMTKLEELKDMPVVPEAEPEIDPVTGKKKRQRAREGFTAAALEKLAKALSEATKISARAVGLDDVIRVKGAPGVAANVSEGGPRPTFVFNMSPDRPKDATKIIDVQGA